jgi:hypothetical protein
MNTNSQQNYDEWMKKIQGASRPREDASEKEEEKIKDGVLSQTSDSKVSRLRVIIAASIFFLLAFIPRVIFIYYISNPDNPGAGWFGDAYHHWQIAYLTKTVGLSHGFLRLWDLKGMEYFWGLLHPLVMLIAFSLTGNYTVGLERTVTSLFGSISVALVFLLCKKYWNWKTAIAAALFAALNPIGVFNDASGMVEPIGIPFLLLGVYLWPEMPILSGISFVFALTARAEYWVFSIFLVGAMVIFTKKIKSDRRWLLILGFLIPLGIYMKYLLNWTADPIYPFYQNYVANIFGTWQLKPTLSATDYEIKYLYDGILVVSSLFAAFVLWKKPKGMYLFLLGIGNWIFLGATFGVGAYIKSYMSYVWYVRFMILPYIFVGVLVSVVFFYYLPKLLKVLGILNWFVFIAFFIVFQLFWIPIWKKYSSTAPTWNQAMRIADGVSNEYHGGGLLLMEGNPEITYALVRFHGVQGGNIVGEMFDPYFYMSGDPYKHWDKNRKVVLHWLQQNNIRTIATYTQYKRYADLVSHEPNFFTTGVAVPNTNIVIYQVNDSFYQQTF